MQLFRTTGLIVSLLAPIAAALACGSESSGPGAAAAGSAGQTTAGTSTAGGGGSGGSAAGGTSTAGSASGGGGSGAGTAGSAGTSATGGGGNGGSSGANGGGGGSGGQPEGDTAPWRPLAVTADKAKHDHTFDAKDADPEVSFNDGAQRAVVDNRAAKLVGKLVLPFGGSGSTAGTLGGQGNFCIARGFHVLAIAAWEDYNILIGDADFYGDARKQVFDGMQHTTKGDFANVKMVEADGVARRTQKALQYLHGKYPTEDWGYYLNQDGTVRWSDVIFTGMSHGASNAARFAKLVRASRVVSISGPRDNMCTSLTVGACGGVVANWFDEDSKTPKDRFFAITGVSDEQHLQHLYAMEVMGYTGTATKIQGASAPYGGSHRLIAAGGHEEYCGQSAYNEACNYAFDVPAENQAGVP